MKTNIKFDKVEYQAFKVGQCKCGKTRRRQKTFWQTQNPFNKNKKGKIKTRDEIYDELIKEAQAWGREPIICDNCE